MSAYSMAYGNYEPNVLLSSLHMLQQLSVGMQIRKGCGDHSYYNKNSRVSGER